MRYSFSWFRKSLAWNNPESSHAQIPWIRLLILDTALHLPETIYHFLFWWKILHMLLLIVTVCVSSSSEVLMTFALCTILWLEFLSSSKVKYHLICNLPGCFIGRRSNCVPGRMQQSSSWRRQCCCWWSKCLQQLGNFQSSWGGNLLLLCSGKDHWVKLGSQAFSWPPS